MTSAFELDLRPLSLGEILDRAFRLLRHRFLMFLTIAAVPQLLLLMVRLGMALLRGDAPEATDAPTGVLAIGWMVVGLIAWVIAYALSQAATVICVSHLYLGRPTSARLALAGLKEAAARVLGVSLVSTLLIALGSLLLLVPGIIFTFWFALATQAAALERMGPSMALERSKELMKGNWGRAFVIMLLGGIIGFALTILFTVPLVLAGLAEEESGTPPGFAPQLVTGLADSVINVLSAPFPAIAMSLLYYDARVRREAFDLRVMTEGLDTSRIDGIPRATGG